MSDTTATARPVRTGVSALVKEALLKADGDPERATRCLLVLVGKNTTARNALLLLGAKHAVMQFFHEQRRSALTMAEGRVAMTVRDAAPSERVAARLARVAFWDSYTLYGMTPLREATRDMLVESAARREVNGRAELAWAKFERAVAAALPDDEATVAEALDGSLVERLAVKHAGRK